MVCHGVLYKDLCDVFGLRECGWVFARESGGAHVGGDDAWVYEFYFYVGMGDFFGVGFDQGFEGGFAGGVGAPVGAGCGGLCLR